MLRQFKGDRYAFGRGALGQVGPMAAGLGRRAAVIRGQSAASQRVAHGLRAALESVQVALVAEIEGARPNAPRDDVLRIANELAMHSPDLVVAVGGGSNIDAAKAGVVLQALRGSVDDYFGTARVTEVLESTAQRLPPILAVQMAASSGAHLTKYANVTDVGKAQKRLIVDEAIVPARAVFEYGVTTTMPAGLTADGALDGLAHLVEVLYGLVGREQYELAEAVAIAGVRLIAQYVERAVHEPIDLAAREALGVATDLGAYAIMIGGTNGGHLTSFSLVDILSHGRACAIMNPYYTVFFAPAIERPLRVLGGIFREAGLSTVDLDALSGRSLGLEVAAAMLELSRRIGVPTTFREVEGFGAAHMGRALAAAKNPQLRMKLANMPVPLSTDMVDDYMSPVLEAAWTGDLGLIRSVPQTSS